MKFTLGKPQSSVGEYYAMPKLYQLESYEECFFDELKYSEPVYCIADVYIKPNRSSENFLIIEKNSYPAKTHYRHDHLVFGVCINRCKKLLQRFDKLTQQEYFSPTPENFTEFKLDPSIFRHGIEDDFEFGMIVNECINYELKKKHQLEAYSRIQNCEVNERVEDFGKYCKYSIEV